MIVFLLASFAVILSTVGCIDNPTLPNFVRLPFEGSGQIVRENEAEMMDGFVILEVEGRCDGYATGAKWISLYEEELGEVATFIGIGKGIDEYASGTDSRPCLRYKVVRIDISLFCEVVFAAAAETGMWKVYISEVIDGSELRRVSSWDHQKE